MFKRQYFVLVKVLADDTGGNYSVHETIWTEYGFRKPQLGRMLDEIRECALSLSIHKNKHHAVNICCVSKL